MNDSSGNGGRWPVVGGRGLYRPPATDHWPLNLSAGFPLQVCLEQFKNPFVFIGPTRRLDKSVVFDRINCQFPILFPQFNQSLHQPHRILEMDVDVHHPVTDQKGAFQSLCKINRRAAFVAFGIPLRQIEDV